MPTPPDMSVRFDHDGVTWILPATVPRWLFAAALAVPAAVGLALAAAGQWLGLVAAAALVSVGAAAGRRLTRSVVLRLDARRLTDGTTEVRLDDIARASISEDPFNERAAIVIETVQGDRHVLAVGARREQLAAFAEWLADARRRVAERERVDGREWSFLRAAPEALHHLRD